MSRLGLAITCVGLLGWTTMASATEPGFPRSAVWLPVPWEQIPANYQERIASVLNQPTITTKSAPEGFTGTEELYHWLLDHPERVSVAWNRLKVGCVAIETRGDREHHWEDDKGTRLSWRTIVDNRHGRVWYAEGLAKPGPVLPAIPVKAVVVMHHEFVENERGVPMVRHSVDIYIQTDSTAYSLIMRIVGPAAPRLAEQGAKQLLLFFAGIARYCDSYPKEAPSLLAPRRPE